MRDDDLWDDDRQSLIEVVRERVLAPILKIKEEDNDSFLVGVQDHQVQSVRLIQGDTMNPKTLTETRPATETLTPEQEPK
jgi:hypothetical protein